jgi:hypothetical protein
MSPDTQLLLTGIAIVLFVDGAGLLIARALVDDIHAIAIRDAEERRDAGDQVSDISFHTEA